MKTNPNDFAFSDRATELCETSNVDGIIDAYCPPLTKREYFAAIAMQGLISTFSSTHTITTSVYIGITSEAVFFADMLIKQLNEGKNE